MKESRFVLSFEKVDKKILRKEKKFRPKSEHNMLQTEELIKWTQINFGDNMVSLKCLDVQEGYEYVFDSIEVKSTEEFSIVEEITKQININSHQIENSNKLITDINRQYKTEKESKDYKPAINIEQTKFDFTTNKNSEIKRVSNSELIDNLFA